MSRDQFLSRTYSGSNGLSHRRAKKQEKELAKRGGGRVTAGSGNKHVKGDVTRFHGIFRVEAKTTQRKSFSVTRAMFDKLTDAALTATELPVIVVEFADTNGKSLTSLAVLSLSDLEELVSNHGS